MNRSVKNTMVFAFPFIALVQTLSACPRCRAQAAAGIHNSEFGVHLFLMLLPILIMMALVFGFYYVDEFIEKSGRR